MGTHDVCPRRLIRCNSLQFCNRHHHWPLFRRQASVVATVIASLRVQEFTTPFPRFDGVRSSNGLDHHEIVRLPLLDRPLQVSTKRHLRYIAACRFGPIGLANVEFQCICPVNKPAIQRE